MTSLADNTIIRYPIYIICLTETWGDDEKISAFKVPDGYKPFYHNRRNRYKGAK